MFSFGNNLKLFLSETEDRPGRLWEGLMNERRWTAICFLLVLRKWGFFLSFPSLFCWAVLFCFLERRGSIGCDQGRQGIERREIPIFVVVVVVVFHARAGGSVAWWLYGRNLSHRTLA
jgi:hypothetical protein